MAFSTHDHSGVVTLTSSLLDHRQIVHGFSTRLGGVSQGIYAAMNLRGSQPLEGVAADAPEHIRENYRRLCSALGADMDRLVLSRQVHQDTVRQVTAADAGKGLLRPADYTADALVTNVPGMSLMVFSADCTILLLHDPVTGSIGAVHAGWRGAALDLPAKAVAEMGRLYGARPRDIRVAIGPGIGACCFETHDDVPDALRSAFGRELDFCLFPLADRPGKWAVDLKAVSAWRLTEAGVPRGQIDLCPVCTACNTDLFWSHRRTGDHRGVQGGLIGLRP